MRFRPLLGLLTAAATLAAVPAAGQAAARSEYLAAPAYPNTRLAIAVKGRPRAGKVTTVVVSGRNEPNEVSPGSGTFISYGIELFVQDPRVVKTCPRSYDAELNNLINLSRYITQIGRDLNAGDGGNFRIPVKYESGLVRRVLFCAYTRVIVDDAAVSALRYTFARPRRR